MRIGKAGSTCAKVGTNSLSKGGASIDEAGAGSPASRDSSVVVGGEILAAALTLEDAALASGAEVACGGMLGVAPGLLPELTVNCTSGSRAVLEPALDSLELQELSQMVVNSEPQLSPR
jgi:hypothetical protein